MFFRLKKGVSEKMDDCEETIFHKYFSDLIISCRICHLDHQTSYFKVAFIQIVNNLHLLISFFSLQPILLLLLLFLPSVFSLLILWQVSLLQLSFKLLFVFIFLMLLQDQLLLVLITFLSLQPIL